MIAENSKTSVFASKEFAKKLIDVILPIAENIVLLDYLQDIEQPLKWNKVEGYCQGPKGTHFLARLILDLFKNALGYD